MLSKVSFYSFNVRSFLCPNIIIIILKNYVISIQLRKSRSVSKLSIIKNRFMLIVSAQPALVKFCLDPWTSLLSARGA